MTNVKKMVLGAVCIIVLSGAVIGGKYLISVQKYKKIVSELKIGKVDLAKVSNGKYTGSCDAEFVAAEVIQGEVLKAQSLQVDTISGATNSSKVILKSIENALTKK